MKITSLLILTLLLITSLLNTATAQTAATSSASDAPPPVATAAESSKQATVFERRIRRDAALVYKQLFTALENNGYFVVFETNIGKNLSRFAQRWGDDYNKNKLESIRSLIFCNGWYANQVSNHDPKMLALCPMHITLTHKEGVSSILYIRPGQVARHSAASKIANELEQDVIRIINSLP